MDGSEGELHRLVKSERDPHAGRAGVMAGASSEEAEEDAREADPFAWLGQTATLVLWMGVFHLNALVVAAAALLLPLKACAAFLAAWFVLAVLPNTEPFPRWGVALARHVNAVAEKYFSLTVVYDDEAALEAASGEGRTLVFGVEPHNVLPLALVAFSPGSQFMRRWRNSRTLFTARGGSTSAIFRVPLARHLWTWLGLSPADKRTMKGFLDKGRSAVLCPGGVAEALVMEHDVETLYLRKRFGFVKMALETGSSLVPVFFFGQRACYNWYRPGPPLVPKGLLDAMSRTIGFAPMLFWGRWCGPIPLPAKITVAIGRPIPVEKTPEPTKEQVAALLETFVRETDSLFQRHKGPCGWPDLKLNIL